MRPSILLICVGVLCVCRNAGVKEGSLRKPQPAHNKTSRCTTSTTNLRLLTTLPRLVQHSVTSTVSLRFLTICDTRLSHQNHRFLTTICDTHNHLNKRTDDTPFAQHTGVSHENGRGTADLEPCIWETLSGCEWESQVVVLHCKWWLGFACR